MLKLLNAYHRFQLENRHALFLSMIPDAIFEQEASVEMDNESNGPSYR